MLTDTSLDDEAVPDRRSFLGLWTVVLVTIVSALGVALYWNGSDDLTPQRAQQKIHLATIDLDNGNNETAYDHLQTVLKAYPDNQEARRLLAIACVNRRRSDELGGLVSELPDEYLINNFDESWGLARFMTSFGFLYQALPLLERLTEINAEHTELQKELIRCYRISGQNAAAGSLLCLRISGSNQDLQDLLMLSATRLHWVTNSDIQFMKHVGQKSMDPLTLLGYARQEIELGRFSTGIAVTQQIIARKPEWQWARIQLALVQRSVGDETAWHQAVTSWNPDDLHDADSWFLLGMLCHQSGNAESAIRCFGEALERDSKHLATWTQLPVVLNTMDRPDEAVRISQFTQHLANIDQYCQDLSHHEHPDTVALIVRECVELGWMRLAKAWLRYGRRHWSDRSWNDELVGNSGTEGDCGLTGNPLQKVAPTLDYHRYARPALDSLGTSAKAAANTNSDTTTTWRFTEDAARLGINFRFENGLDPHRGRAYMFEFAGPGVGVIDFDRDGWPDLHLTQGAPWPLRSENTALRDELFRNLGDGTFTTVADHAGVGEPGYSQGPAVGDFDGDGFPDLYVCNIGPNRCYRNNGDGTFTELTDAAGVAGDEWSISAAWADFNADGLPDLYVTNYLTGDVLERSCHAIDGRPVQCPPMQFPGADDRLYLNNGDGSFQDVSAEAGITIPDGKGMGMVVGRFGGARQLGIYVANDTTPNYLFIRQDQNSATPQFEERAALLGVAYGPQGNAQSSMGVALGDVNNDGRNDLFVTNWFAESPNLFLQLPGPVFDDQASQFGLIGEGRQYEGWGTQFIDVDADGAIDLFVANGHLEENDPAVNRMPPQLYRNEQGRYFRSVTHPHVGPYFQGQYLGRSAVVWDWNRDGRQDLAVSHATDPTAVLTNRSEQVGHWLSLRLVSTRSARDPIGARASVKTADITLVRERVAGDGYAASNEESIYFGLGNHSSATEVTVEWPSGNTQIYSLAEVDAAYVLIEDRTAPIRLHTLANEQTTMAR